MNRTDRLLAILLELQARRYQRAEDLAATFEVSKRTIYRDMTAIAESGVPLVSTPGQGYSLMEGYFLPPLSFTTDEAITLLLGSDFVAQNVDAQYQAAARSAASKILAVLSPDLRADVAYLQRNIQFVPAHTAMRRDMLQVLRRAIIQKRTVQFDYRTRFAREGQPAVTHREVDPYALVNVAGSWYVVAYCHLRHDIRNFRLDRIGGEMKVSNRVFVRRPDFKLGPPPQDDRRIQVRLLFDPEIAHWVRETPSYFQVGAEECEEGLIVTLTIRSHEEIVQWLLGWGAHVRVLEPAALRKRLAAEARAMLRNYES